MDREAARLARKYWSAEERHNRKVAARRQVRRQARQQLREGREEVLPTVRPIGRHDVI